MASDLTLTYCPDNDCLLPAEVVDDYVLDSTAGPVRHIATRCVNRHHYVSVEPSPLP